MDDKTNPSKKPTSTSGQSNSYSIAPDNVGIFQQSNSNTGAWIDVLGSGINSVVRLINNYPQRWELRNGALENGDPAAFDLYSVDSNGNDLSVFNVSNPNGSGLALQLTLPPPASGSQLQLPKLPSASNTSDLCVDSAGNVYTQNSSIRYKEDVKPLAEDYAKALALIPMSFKYKGCQGEQIGYIAEDVEAAGLSHLVSHDSDGRPEAVSYKHLGIYALELLKQQQNKIDELQAALVAIETRLANLRPQT